MEECSMTEGETMYLGMALALFVLFGLVLFYVSARGN